jgi:hypothetical protein
VRRQRERRVIVSPAATISGQSSAPEKTGSHRDQPV